MNLHHENSSCIGCWRRSWFRFGLQQQKDGGWVSGAQSVHLPLWIKTTRGKQKKRESVLVFFGHRPLTCINLYIYIYFGDKMTNVSHYTVFSLRIIHQQEFSHLYGLALCTLLNISVSSRSLNRSFDQLAPGMETETSSHKYTAGYTMIMKSTWEQAPPPLTGACTCVDEDAHKHTHTHTNTGTQADTERGPGPDMRWDEVAFLIIHWAWLCLTWRMEVGPGHGLGTRATRVRRGLRRDL